MFRIFTYASYTLQETLEGRICSFAWAGATETMRQNLEQIDMISSLLSGWQENVKQALHVAVFESSIGLNDLHGIYSKSFQ